MRAILVATLLAGCAAGTPAPAAPTRGHMSSGDAPQGARRETHPQDDLTCQDESPTGTMIERRKCRSDSEKAQDRKVVEDIYLDPSSRPMITK
jgi:hypothetical protein